MRCGREGYIMTLTLGVLLALALLFMALLELPGSVRRRAVRVAREVQEVYDAESSLLLHLEGFPHSAIPGLPPVSESALGPYGRLCASPDSTLEVCVTTVSKLERLDYREWAAGMESYRSSLRETLLRNPALRGYSGNRRFSDAPVSAYLQVRDGDLRLALAGCVPSLNAVVSGDVVVEGETAYDTLRIYAAGNVTLKGRVRIAFLEIAAGERAEISGAVHFRGIVSARREVALRGSAVADYPSMAVALGQNGTEVNVAAGVRFSGLRAALPGNILADDSVMPSFLDGRKVVFERRVAR